MNTIFKKYSFPILLITILSIFSLNTNAQLVGTDVFIQGLYAELGICKNGAFGSTADAPAGYHPRGGSAPDKIGFVSDPQKNGWTIGTPDYVGDYFLPGTPHEGWDVQIGTIWNKAWRSSSSTTFSTSSGPLLLTGSNTGYSVSGSKKIGVWEGSMGNLSIKKETILDTNQLYFVINVTLKNTGTTTLNDIYYHRNVDPDNEEQLTGSFETTNTIVYQPGTPSGSNKCLVKAVGATYPGVSYLGLGTVDCRAKCYYLNGDLMSVYKPAVIYNTPALADATITPGSSYTYDAGMGLIFEVGDLAAGDSTVLAYAYILKESDLDSAFTVLTPRWDINGTEYNDNDTIVGCIGDTINASIVGGSEFTWGAWTKIPGGATGITGTSGSFAVPAVTTRYRVIGTSVNCSYNDTMTFTVIRSGGSSSVTATICPGQTYNFLGTSLTTAGTYIDTLTTSLGCDSVVTLNLSVSSVILTSISASICAGESYSGYTSTGIYVDSFVTSAGCDSVRTLNLTVSPTKYKSITDTICTGESLLGYTTTGIYIDTLTSAGGCDSIRTLNLTVLPVSVTNLVQTICSGESYLGYTTTGIYYDTFSNIHGCDSVRKLTLTVLSTLSTTLTASICAGSSYLGYTATGVYVDSFTSTSGCDSIRTINLTVNPTKYKTLTISICEGETYAGYTTTGTYIDTLTSAAGCDSIRTIHLTVNPIKYSTFTDTICNGESVFGYTATGVYSDTFASSAGCDSIRTLYLTVNPTSITNLTSTICAGSSYLGYSATGIYYDTFTNIYGCDSVRKITLTVIPIINTTKNISICEGESYLGYSSSGTYVDTFAAVSGCDSIRTLVLTVKSITYSTITANICVGDSYLGYTTTGIYVDTLVNAEGCDSIRTLNLTVSIATYSYFTDTICSGESFWGHTTTGTHYDTFVNANGCDSVRTLYLTVNPTSLTTIYDTICFGDSKMGYTATGTYYDTFSNIYGCDSVRIFHLFERPEIINNLSIQICYGESYNGYTTSGFYHDTFTSYLGCDSMVNLSLTVSDPVQNVIIDTSVCGMFTLDGKDYYYNTTVFDTLLNYFGCDSIITRYNVTVHPESPIPIDVEIVGCGFAIYNGQTYYANDTFTDTLRSIYGCDSIYLTTTIRIVDFQLDLDVDTLDIYEGEHVEMTTSANMDYRVLAWLPTSAFPLQTAKEQFIVLPNSGTYSVIAQNDDGCKDTASVHINIIEYFEDVTIPNAFSPNGDGLNDKFGPEFRISREYNIDKMVIYNRWGQLVYSNFNKREMKWDGTYYGKPADVGVYFYEIFIDFRGKKKYLKGEVHLIR